MNMVHGYSYEIHETKDKKRYVAYFLFRGQTIAVRDFKFRNSAIRWAERNVRQGV